MRLIILSLIGVLCLAFAFGQDRVDLLDVANQGSVHAVNGNRKVRSHHYDSHHDPHYDPHHGHYNHHNDHHDSHHDPHHHYGH
ncbi:uncharacterized protein DMAD_03679 [Drosophila madeirensis]|uniref:Histidine-rich glycoprotein n=1 Tax=Drosophila madeirensis TaxID=30013 RepID=A0AAU9GAP2_DROMD